MNVAAVRAKFGLPSRVSTDRRIGSQRYMDSRIRAECAEEFERSLRVFGVKKGEIKFGHDAPGRPTCDRVLFIARGCLILNLLRKGAPVWYLAEFLETSQRTIRRWKAEFRARGVL